MIIGGIKIHKSGTDKTHWRFTWQEKSCRISGLEKITGMGRSSIYKCIRKSIACWVGYLSCGRVLPMLTKHEAKKHAPEGLSNKLLEERLDKEQYLDLSVTELEKEQMGFRNSIDFVPGESIQKTRHRLENMRLHRLFATLPRPKGMIDETKDWVKPAW